MKSIYKAVSASVFLLACGLSFAGEPINLNTADMDQVNAGLTFTSVASGASSINASVTGLSVPLASSTSVANNLLIPGLISYSAGGVAFSSTNASGLATPVQANSSVTTSINLLYP
jgi:hypothetical protein